MLVKESNKLCLEQSKTPSRFYTHYKTNVLILEYIDVRVHIKNKMQELH